jgi:hypothetical protein
MMRAIALIKSSPYIRTHNNWRHVKKYIEMVISYKQIREIIQLPIHRPISVNVNSDSSYRDITIAIGLAGWTAWTTIDRAIDERDEVRERLTTYSIFRMVLIELIQSSTLSRADFRRIRRILCDMEYANSPWCAFPLRKRSVLKSIGAAIPMMIYLMKCGVDLRNIDRCYLYFYHLIAARQLSDDALDWQEDMQHDNYTVVTKSLSRNGNTEYLKAFHSIISPRIMKEILRHSRRSISYARSMTCFRSTDFLEALPKQYEKMALDGLSIRFKRATSSSLRRAS